MSASLSFLHSKAQTALRAAIVDANLSPVVVQTLGSAVQSAGTHGAAGRYLDGTTWRDYSACIDFSTNQLALRLSDEARVKNDARAHSLVFGQSRRARYRGVVSLGKPGF